MVEQEGHIRSKQRQRNITVNTIREKLLKKYPDEFNDIEQELKNELIYTKEVKNKYPQYSNLKKYSSKAGFHKTLISNRDEGISAQPLFNLVIIEEKCLPKIEILQDFAPEFLDKALKQTLGSNINDKEKISGHEMEHTKALALKTYAKIAYTAAKKLTIPEENVDKAKKLDSKLIKLKNKSEFYAESQRVLKYSESVNDAIEAIAIMQVFPLLLYAGIETGLKTKINMEYFIKSFSESPDEKSREVKGRYPYLKEKTIYDVAKKIDEIRENLKQKYEDKYGKIESLWF